MKMFKLMGKRGFAVFTSLALCVGLVAPSFAATFDELREAVSGSDGTYGANQDITRAGDKITLNGDVTRAKGDDEAIQINSKVTIDLNGHTIDGTKTDEDNDRDRVVLKVNNSGDLTVTDGSEDGGGKITGGTWGGVRVDGGAFTLDGGSISENTSTDGNRGGVHVENGGTFTMNGGEISGSNGSGVRVEDGSFTMTDGTITGNTISEEGAGGGGVYVTNGSFTMTGGEISGNSAAYSGGGVGIKGEGSSFTMSGGEISGNTAENHSGNIAGNGGGGGGGVWIKDQADFEMSGGEITGNKVEGSSGNGGGVAIHQAKFEMSGGKIADNESARGTGVLINAGSNYGGDASFTMTGGYTAGQDGKSCIYLEESEEKNAKFVLSDDAVMDGSIFLGQGTQVITNNVTQPGGVHKYTGFDATETKLGNALDFVTPEQTEGGNGYEADRNTLLDIRYDHVYGDGWASDGENTHSHSCEYCREKQPNTAQDHDWIISTTPATCTAEGKITHTCKDCGETKSDPIKMLPHSWVETTTEGTCAAESKITRTCKDCGATETETGEKNPANHKGETYLVGEKPASYEEDGYTGDTHCGSCDGLIQEGKPIHLVPPETIIDEPFVPLAPLPDEVEIEEPEVPLAGLLTRADVIGYLWEKSGSPDAALSDFEDVPADHQWAVAIGWAQSAGIAVAGVDGSFRPDDLVLRSVEDIELSPEGELEQFLNRYAVYAGIKLEEGELFIALEGEWDDIIMGEEAQVIFDDFFARLELALARAA